jgi:predicted nucleic acid-binding protein
MRILLDANIVLDVLLNREPFVDDSRRLWQLVDDGAFEGSIASFSLPTIHYICRRHAGRAAADAAVDTCLEAFEVCPLYREGILAARRIPGNDFEDNLQVACALTDAGGLATVADQRQCNCPFFLTDFCPTGMQKCLLFDFSSPAGQHAGSLSPELAQLAQGIARHLEGLRNRLGLGGQARVDG